MGGIACTDRADGVQRLPLAKVKVMVEDRLSPGVVAKPVGLDQWAVLILSETNDETAEGDQGDDQPERREAHHSPCAGRQPAIRQRQGEIGHCNLIGSKRRVV